MNNPNQQANQRDALWPEQTIEQKLETLRTEVLRLIRKTNQGDCDIRRARSIPLALRDKEC